MAMVRGATSILLLLLLSESVGAPGRMLSDAFYLTVACSVLRLHACTLQCIERRVVCLFV